MNCVICQHERRSEIENELLCRQWGVDGYSLDAISEKYSVPVRDLQVHALMHIPVQQVTGDASSITQKIGMAEADMLRQTASTYYTTLQGLSERINRAVLSEDDAGLRIINKPLVDLYLGTGSELRATVDSLVKMNQAVNGEDNSGLSALAALVNTVRGSKEND